MSVTGLSRPHARASHAGVAEVETRSREVRVLAVADSDSFVKWTAHTLTQQQAHGWSSTLVLLRTSLMPSASQVEHALHGTPWADGSARGMGVSRLLREVERMRPDVLFLGCTAPVVHAITRSLAKRSWRPVIVTGFPGISYPAKGSAVDYRRACDVIAVHSPREQASFDQVIRLRGGGTVAAWMGLPFLPERVAETEGPHAAPSGERTVRASDVKRVVFTPQSLVPVTRSERGSIVQALGWLAQRHPHLEVIVKLRAVSGEVQTHTERDNYAGIIRDLSHRRGVDRLTVATGPLQDYLDEGTALVTVSSTASLEALSLGLPVLLLSDFGVGQGQMLPAYVGSGLLGDLNDLEQGRFYHPDPRWMSEGYFAQQDDNLTESVLALVERQREGSLLPIVAPRPVKGWLKLRRTEVSLRLPVWLSRRLGSVLRKYAA